MGEGEEMKRILLIMPNFYGYTDYIKDEITNQGYSIDVYYEEPPRLLFLVLRNLDIIIGKPLFLPFSTKLLIKKIARAGIKYDKLLVIRGNIFSEKLICVLKSKVLKEYGDSVYYTWDSFSNVSHKGLIAKSFDRRFTFDSWDAKNNSDWRLLPLFYSGPFDYDKNPLNEIEYIYDLCCIASFNRYRYETLQEIVVCNKELRFKILLYIDKKLYDYKKKVDPFFRNVDESWICHDPLSFEQIVYYYNQSKAILDITYENQNGLSMRTIESVGLKKKLVTNNYSVKEYPFYTDSNVFLLSNQNTISKEWFEQPYNLDDNIRKNYSIHHWTEILLG